MEIEKGFLTGSLRFLPDEMRNEINKAIFKTTAYFDIIKARKGLDERKLNELSLVDNMVDVIKIQSEGYNV